MAVASAEVGSSAPTLSLQAAVEGFLHHCRYERNLSGKTISAYQSDLRQFERHLASASGDVTAIGKAELRAYIASLFEAFAERSVRRKVATLKSLFGFLEHEETIPSSPFRKMRLKLKRSRVLPVTLSLESVERLFRHLYGRRSQEADPRRRWTLSRDIAVMEFLFSSGARIAETCNLRTDDVDYAGGSIRIRGKGRRERIVDVCNVDALRALREYAGLAPARDAAGYFFQTWSGRRLSEEAVRTALRAYCHEAGIAGRVTPHVIRHTVATLLLEEGVDIRYIQALLGHSSLSTTELYTHVHRPAQRSTLARSHPRNRLLIE